MWWVEKIGSKIIYGYDDMNLAFKKDQAIDQFLAQRFPVKQKVWYNMYKCGVFIIM